MTAPITDDRNVTKRHLLQAVADDVLVTLPSADHAGPDAEELLWALSGPAQLSVGTAQEAAVILELQTGGLVAAGDQVEIQWSCHLVKGFRLVITPAGQRTLTRWNGGVGGGSK